MISTGDKQNEEKQNRTGSKWQTKLNTKQGQRENSSETKQTHNEGEYIQGGKFRSYRTLCESKIFSSHLNA